jgi:hypothetical protein
MAEMHNNNGCRWCCRCCVLLPVGAAAAHEDHTIGVPQSSPSSSHGPAAADGVEITMLIFFLKKKMVLLILLAETGVLTVARRMLLSPASLPYRSTANVALVDVAFGGSYRDRDHHA